MKGNPYAEIPLFRDLFAAMDNMERDGLVDRSLIDVPWDNISSY